MIHALLLAAATTATSSAASLPSGVIRRLTYSFGISVQTTDTKHVPASSSASDEGTVTADVVGLRPDTGLVVNVQEVRRTLSSVPQAQCIVWGIGTVVCEPGAEVTSEERALLRFLGRQFVNDARIDPRGHWSNAVSSKDTKETSTFDIAQTGANPLRINFQRVTEMTGAQAFNATTNGTLIYDKAMSAPVSVDEDTLLRTNHEEVRTSIHLKMLEDSLATASP